MFSMRVLAIVVLTTAIVGCSRNAASTTTDTGPAVSAGPAAAAARSSDVITADELNDPSVRNNDALEAVRRLRPRFLSTRGKGSIRIAGAGSVHISIDGGPLLALSNLARMRPTEISEIRYLNSTDAATRFGTNAGAGGVLLVKSR